MVVLSYDSAKKSLLFLGLYLILASLVFKMIAVALEGNAMALFTSFGSFESMGSFEFSLPEFDTNSMSFDGLKTLLSEKISNFMEVILPAAILYVNFPSWLGSIPMILHMDKSMLVIKI